LNLPLWLALGGTIAFVVLLAVLVGSPTARGSRAAKAALVILGLVTLAILVPFVAILVMLVGGFGP
jgi:small-conductance mechanosensitive channel